MRCMKTEALMQGVCKSEGVESALSEHAVKLVDIRAAVSGETLLQLVRAATVVWKVLK